jgi:hypothetical protein
MVQPGRVGLKWTAAYQQPVTLALTGICQAKVSATTRDRHRSIATAVDINRCIRRPTRYPISPC